jgi:hypothetical protein
MLPIPLQTAVLRDHGLRGRPLLRPQASASKSPARIDRRFGGIIAPPCAIRSAELRPGKQTLAQPARHAVTITVLPVPNDAATSVFRDTITGDGLGFLNGVYERNPADRHRRRLPRADDEDSCDSNPRSDCNRKPACHRFLPAFSWMAF